MNGIGFWEDYTRWQKQGRWVDLSWEVSPKTLHVENLFPPMTMRELFTVSGDGFAAHCITVPGQYGTHVDSPNHMIEGGASLEQFAPEQMVRPLCVIDKSSKVASNEDYMLTAEDVLEWESTYCKIPEGAFVAFCSKWSDRDDPKMFYNQDAAGVRHTPGWSIEALRLLFEERNVASIGHETADTDPGIAASAMKLEAERYVLESGRLQFEMLRDLKKCPAAGALIFCTFPKIKGASGFPARCFALCPN